MGKKALIVADMLRDFMEPQGTLYLGAEAREIIPFVARKIEETRAAGGVVIYVGHPGRGDHSRTPGAARGLPGGKDQL
ncbi:MAG: hypothetical protein HY790_08340 [Deltaproteobacteria bacterium]|nr:hypothetical protein [Deltaproteobacteria bacterium]